MNKIGRSRAKNPEQEKLRTEKSDWNSDASSVISKLIALKQSINGRENKTYSLPPSRIHQPFPTEVSSFLNETSFETQDVLQKAKQIVEHQNHSTQKTASNSLSRFWASIKLYFSLNREIYNHRIRMLSEATSIQKTLERMQKEILEQDPESIAVALTDGALLRAQFMGPFTQNYDQLLEKEWERQKIEKEVGKNKDLSVKIDEQIKEPEIIDELEEKEDVVSTLSEDPPTLKLQKTIEEEEESKKITKLAQEELPIISSLVTYTQTASIDEDIKRRIALTYNTFSKNLAAYEMSMQNPSLLLKSKDLANDLKSDYKYLLSLFKKYVGPGENFKEIFSNLNPDIKKALLHFSLIKVAEQQKEAKQKIWDWIKRKYKSLNSDSFQLLAMECVRLASKSERALNDLMNDLESKKTTIQIIDNKLSIFARLLQAFLQKFLILGKMQTSNIRRFDRTKEWNQISIRSTDLTELQKFISELEVYSQHYDFSKNDGSSTN